MRDLRFKATPEGFLSSHLVNGVEPGTVVRLAAPEERTAGLASDEARIDATLFYWAGCQSRSVGELVDDAGGDLGQRRRGQRRLGRRRRMVDA